MLTLADTVPSFERVYRDQFDFAWRTLRALGVHEAAVDDALQDLFIVVHRRLGEFEGRASVRTWIYEIARRVALRYRTRAVRESSRLTEMSDLPARDDLDAALDHAMATGVMQDFLWTLDDDRRRAFVLSEFGEMAGREIAEALDVNMNTVYARIRSARTELDRLARRLHACDANGLTRALRTSPTETSRRRAWAGVLAVVGRPSGLLAGLGLSHGSLAWAAGGIAVAGLAGTLALGGSSSPASAVPVDAPSAPAVGSLAPSKPEVRRVETPAPPDPPPTPEATTAPRARSPLSPRAPRTPTKPSLSSELALVRSLRAAVRDGAGADARAMIASYRAHHDRGALRLEVDGLEVELACRTHAPDASEQLRRLVRTTPDALLLARLKAICVEPLAPRRPASVEDRPESSRGSAIGPQNTEGRGTPPR